jgi:hypothetical protein
MHHIDTIPTDTKVKPWSDSTAQTPDWQFRINVRKGVTTLWRKNNHPAFYGGHQIMLVALETRLAREWLDAAGYDTFALNMRSKA